MTDVTTWRDGDIVRYTNQPQWARHGIARVYVLDGKVWGNDTYWGMDDREHFIDPSDLEGATLLGNIHDFDTQHRYPYDFDDFAEADTFWIPIGGGSEQKWIRKGAAPVEAQVLARLEYLIERAEQKVRTSLHNLTWQHKELRLFVQRAAHYAVKEQP